MEDTAEDTAPKGHQFGLEGNKDPEKSGYDDSNKVEVNGKDYYTITDNMTVVTQNADGSWSVTVYLICAVCGEKVPFELDLSLADYAEDASYAERNELEFWWTGYDVDCGVEDNSEHGNRLSRISRCRRLVFIAQASISGSDVLQ